MEHGRLSREVEKRKCDHEAASQGETDQGGQGIGLPEKPKCHRQDGSVNDKMPFPVFTRFIPERAEKTPQRTEREDHAHRAEKVFPQSHTNEAGEGGPPVVLPAKVGVILDKQNGERDQQEDSP